MSMLFCLEERIVHRPSRQVYSTRCRRRGNISSTKVSQAALAKDPFNTFSLTETVGQATDEE